MVLCNVGETAENKIHHTIFFNSCIIIFIFLSAVENSLGKFLIKWTFIHKTPQTQKPVVNSF